MRLTMKTETCVHNPGCVGEFQIGISHCLSFILHRYSHYEVRACIRNNVSRKTMDVITYTYHMLFGSYNARAFIH